MPTTPLFTEDDAHSLFQYLPEAVLLTGALGQLTYINPAAEALFGLPAAEALGRSKRFLYATQDEERTQDGDASSTYRTSYLRGDGTLFLGDTTVGTIRRDGGIRGTITTIRVASVVEQTVDVLQRLHTITNDTERSFSERMDGILQLGTEHFGLPLAIQSRIVDDRFVVEHCRDPTGGLVPGTTFDLPGTYCTHTLQAAGPTGFHHVANSPIETHPCYRDFKLEAYLGCPIQIDGKPYGTLSFSRFDPSRPFTRDDMALVQLFADWAGHAIRQEMSQRELQLQARTDVLTGLLNRRAIMEALAWQLAHARRSDLPLSVVRMDLDPFKQINDTWGHDAGEAVLRVFTGICVKVKREVDLCSRFGGEEFLAVLPDTDAAGATRFSERLLAATRSHATQLACGHDVTVTASLGVAQAHPDESIEALVRRADHALYAAKQAGRAQIRLAG